MDFPEFQTKFFQLYQQEKYAEAMKFIVKNAGEFPEQRAIISQWHMCMAALTGDTDKALQVLREALDAGCWYNETMLRDDADLASLQELPEFEELLEINSQRFAEVQADTKPDLLVEAPEGQTGPFPLLITLHSNASTAAASLPAWQPAVADGWLLAVPQSSQLFFQNSFVWNDYEKGEREVKAHNAQIRADYEIDESQVVVGGFSMGGGLACHLALKGTLGARGFVLLGPYVQQDMENWNPDFSLAKERGLRGYIILGMEDEPCRPSAERIKELMDENGLACELEIIPDIAHVYPADFGERLRRALDFVLQRG